MMRTNTESLRQKLAIESERLRERIEKHKKLIEADREAIYAIDEKLRRLTMIEVIGVPGAVRIRFRGLYTDRRLDDAAGCVLAVKRTNAIVDWGVIGRYRMSIADLMLAENASDLQGFFVGVGGAQ